MGNLVLSRKVGEKIVIDDRITLVVVAVRGEKVRLGVQCDRDIPVRRAEVVEINRDTRPRPDSKIVRP